jgi:hypothetical protein
MAQAVDPGPPISQPFDQFQPVGLGTHLPPPESLASALLAWVTQGPAGCGLDRANWTEAELAAHRYRRNDIAVSESLRRTSWTKHGVRPYRPTSHDLKADPGGQAAAQQDLQALTKSRRRGARPAESR